jgi:hypothetical protein
MGDLFFVAVVLLYEARLACLWLGMAAPRAVFGLVILVTLKALGTDGYL